MENELEPKVFGRTKTEIGSIMASISVHEDKNHPFDDRDYNSLKFLENGAEMLSKCNGIKETFGVNFNAET
jgi:hypothetical protein